MPAPLPVGTSQAEIDAIYASIQTDSYNRARTFAASIAPRYLNRHVSIALGLVPGPMPSTLPTGVDQQEYNDILADITAKGDAHCLKLINEQWPNFLQPNLADELAASPPVSIVGTQYSFMTAGTLPTGATLTRSSTGWYINSSKSLASAAANAARWSYDITSGALRGLLNEPAATNTPTNSNCNGAVVGTPGTLPTTWSFSGFTGTMTFNVVGFATVQGFQCVDIRIFGTPTAGAGWQLLMDSGSRTAAPGAIVESVYLALIAGSVAPLSTLDVYLSCVPSGNLEGADIRSQLSASLTRVNNAPQTAPAGTTASLPRILARLSGTPAIDYTLRVALPQVEVGNVPTSPIVTTAGAVTRAADVLTITAPQKTYSTVLVNRLDNQFVASNVTVGAGGYVVPTDPSPLQSVQFMP